MAAGFKTATVNATDVPSTQTNFPSYVDLDRLGITTLAEAESVRVYADSGKTTEWAREIVSVTEMHVKVPSLTSTVEIFVDWDGVRADYAVGATYGRNAVWADYYAVWHLGEAVNNTSDGYVDSTGNGKDGSGVSMAESAISSPTGMGQQFDGVNDYINLPSSWSFNAFTMSAWLKPDTIAGTSYAVIELEGGSYRPLTSLRIATSTNITQFYFRNNSVSPSNLAGAAIGTGTWKYIVGTNNETAQALYHNGVSQDTSSVSTTVSSNFDNAQIGRNTPADGTYYGGAISEARIKKTGVSSNWVVTEYNNQNDEATFWGTWTDAGGGGGGGAAQAARRGVVMMM